MIICGDCIESMQGMESNSVDTVITDPPYGLKFMGKKWDYTIPSIEIWEECLRVAKPGATLLCFGGTRTYHRMACAIEDASWIIKDCIMWLYGSGFPKALDISKQMDKKAGAERVLIKDGEGNQVWTSLRQGKKSEFDRGKERPATYPATKEAQQWSGWKSHGLKPAYEPIIVAMKPNDKTYVDNALKWGVSGFNIDECRIGTTGGTKTGVRKGDRSKFYGGGFDEGTYESISLGKGRFPANVILDEEAGKMLDEQQEGASRFFYCAKSSKSEKNAGCENNGHPCCKPLKLMEYLCRLTKTPTGGVVLDPFTGSGSTGIAAIRTGREFIGIEMDKEYCKIAEARIKNEED